MITPRDRLIAELTVRNQLDWDIQKSIEEYEAEPETMDEHDHLLLAEDRKQMQERKDAGTWNPVEPPVIFDLPKELPKESWEDDNQYAARLQKRGMERGILRQCSIGWHMECSTRRSGGYGCNCPCHEAF